MLTIVIDRSHVVPDDGLDGDWNTLMELVDIKFKDTNPIIFASGQHQYAVLKKMAEMYIEEHKTMQKRLIQLQDMKKISDDAVDEHKELRELLAGMKGNLASIRTWGVTLYNKGLCRAVDRMFTTAGPLVTRKEWSYWDGITVPKPFINVELMMDEDTHQGQVETNQRLASESVDRDGIMKVLNQVAALPMARNLVHKNSPLSIEVADVLNLLGQALMVTSSRVCLRQLIGIDTYEFDPNINVTDLGLPDIKGKQDLYTLYKMDEDNDEVDANEQDGQPKDMEEEQEESHDSPSLPVMPKVPMTATLKAKGKGKASEPPNKHKDKDVNIEEPVQSKPRPKPVPHKIPKCPTDQQDNDNDNEMSGILPCPDVSDKSHPVSTPDGELGLDTGLDGMHIDASSPLSSPVLDPPSGNKDAPMPAANLQLMMDALLAAGIDAFEGQRCSVCPKTMSAPCAALASSCAPISKSAHGRSAHKSAHGHSALLSGSVRSSLALSEASSSSKCSRNDASNRAYTFTSLPLLCCPSLFIIYVFAVLTSLDNKKKTKCSAVHAQSSSTVDDHLIVNTTPDM
ncbi:hypothetical protein EDB19DRAFT_1909985 [Suillus lakei]|nr:hypothetical protein EDB19DRAFT_1909985 [Suillus lakei]